MNYEAKLRLTLHDVTFSSNFDPAETYEALTNTTDLILNHVSSFHVMNQLCSAHIFM